MIASPRPDFCKTPLLLTLLKLKEGIPMIDVFKTNVQKAQQAKKMIALLLSHDPNCQSNFDLDDCDKILRVDSKKLSPATVIQVLNTEGFECEELI